MIITAGARQKPGESRLDLLSRNIEIFREVVPQIAKICPDCIILVVTNPGEKVDIIVRATHYI